MTTHFLNHVGRDSRWLVTHGMRSEIDGTEYDIDDSFCYASGIVGQRFFKDHLDLISSPPSRVSLRPEPENEYDANAIAVFANKLKIGYVPSAAAQWLHSVVSLKNWESGDCWVPLSPPKVSTTTWCIPHDQELSDLWDPTVRYTVLSGYEEYGDTVIKVRSHHIVGVMWLPTIRGLRFLAPHFDFYPKLDRVWCQIGEDTKVRIAQNGWRLNSEIHTQIQSEVGEDDSYPFPVVPPSRDFLFEGYLVHYRRVVARFVHERNLAERNLQIYRRVRKGEDRQVVASLYGLARSTVSAIFQQGNRGKLEEWEEMLQRIPQSEVEIASIVLTELLNDHELTRAEVQSWLKKHQK